VGVFVLLKMSVDVGNNFCKYVVDFCCCYFCFMENKDGR
jgi:hypothetical protein